MSASTRSKITRREFFNRIRSHLGHSPSRQAIPKRDVRLGGVDEPAWWKPARPLWSSEFEIGDLSFSLACRPLCANCPCFHRCQLKPIAVVRSPYSKWSRTEPTSMDICSPRDVRAYSSPGSSSCRRRRVAPGCCLRGSFVRSSRPHARRRRPRRPAFRRKRRHVRPTVCIDPWDVRGARFVNQLLYRLTRARHGDILADLNARRGASHSALNAKRLSPRITDTGASRSLPSCRLPGGAKLPVGKPFDVQLGWRRPADVTSSLRRRLPFSPAPADGLP